MLSTWHQADRAWALAQLDAEQRRAVERDLQQLHSQFPQHVLQSISGLSQSTAPATAAPELSGAAAAFRNSIGERWSTRVAQAWQGATDSSEAAVFGAGDGSESRLPSALAAALREISARQMRQGQAVVQSLDQYRHG